MEGGQTFIGKFHYFFILFFWNLFLWLLFSLIFKTIDWSGDHVQHLTPSNSGSVFLNSYVDVLLVFLGSIVYRGTFLVFPYSNSSWGTLLVFPDTNLCSKILLNTILWGKCPKIGKSPNFCESLKKRDLEKYNKSRRP